MKKVTIKCPRCNGTGTVRYNGYGAFGESEGYDEDCPACKGTGTLTGEAIENEFEKPLNYFGYAFDNPADGYNEEYAKSSKGQKDIKKQLKRNKKFQKQLRETGLDVTETWNLDYTIASFVLPRLKMFKDNLHSYPGDLTPKKWDKYLNKMIRSFEIVVNDECGEEVGKEFERGMKLFCKYFRGLWD